ncbi:MAG TPA: isoprenylcysteine carboxylmethyltransferase family protein [Acetobacteraceae bacterium]|nr:isoprenylcysteine carboxylmethyltransferase family protein [Acetobacteraceae bacterium]
MSSTVANRLPGHLRVPRDPAQILGSLWFLALAVILVWPDARPIPGLVQALSRYCLVLFYVILSLLLVLRPPAKARATGIIPGVVAFAGTYLPWTIPLFPRHGSLALNLCSSGLFLLGLALSIATVTQLGRSFSLVPQARSLVRRGPYRWIRHPLYLAEEIAVVGSLLQFFSIVTLSIVLMHGLLQLCRIHYEESLLHETFPEYAAYARESWRLIPLFW